MKRSCLALALAACALSGCGGIGVKESVGIHRNIWHYEPDVSPSNRQAPLNLVVAPFDDLRKFKTIAMRWFSTEYSIIKWKQYPEWVSTTEGLDHYDRLWASWLADDLTASHLAEVRFASWGDISEMPTLPDLILTGALIEKPHPQCFLICVELRLHRPQDPRKTLWRKEYDILAILKATPGAILTNANGANMYAVDAGNMKAVFAYARRDIEAQLATLTPGRRQ